jgi:tRNA threonylcarbamoyladenosine biosynthesis protein TsaB
MALILSLETSTHVCSVALHHNGKLLATSEVHVEQSHASKLALLVEEVLKITGADKAAIQAVAISSGPGSYTGLRIGTSTAKGFCFVLDIPLITINTLELLAHQVFKLSNLESYLCPMLDARRLEVYCMVIDWNMNVINPVEAKVVDEASFSDLLDQRKVIFFGDGSTKCQNIIKHPNAYFLQGIYPAASQLGILAWEKFQKKDFEDLVRFEPFYLKDFLIKQSKKNPI